MKKAYELSTLTGTQVLLLVVSEAGLVYTFTTAKLQPLVTQPEGKNLIQACLNAPHGTLPSSLPVGPPLGRPAPQVSLTSPGGANNLPGGLSISAPPKDKDDEGDDVPDSAPSKAGEKRRRRPSSNTNPPNTPPSARSLMSCADPSLRTPRSYIQLKRY
jgi:pheromone receptor transcription factor